MFGVGPKVRAPGVKIFHQHRVNPRPSLHAEPKRDSAPSTNTLSQLRGFSAKTCDSERKTPSKQHSLTVAARLRQSVYRPAATARAYFAPPAVSNWTPSGSG